MRPRARRRGRHDETGATLVEFALVAPLVFLLIFGIIAGCFLAYQNSAMHDGATAGARMASIETSLVTAQNGVFCESGTPVSIEKTVSSASPLLTVNPAPLCAQTMTATQLTQPAVSGDVNITVTCGGSCAAPTTVAVSLALRTKGLVAPIGLTYNLTASSQVPVLSP
jgi:Flp pilus assembly protein TadG